jgi:subtilisin family serine protease
VTVVDVEGGWDFDHEDLVAHNGRVIHGHQAPMTAWTDHGSAVLGEIAGAFNGFGVTGIASQARIFGASIYDERGQQTSVAAAILAAANFLKRGDIILIELHRIGPRGNYIAMEWWPDNFDAMKYAHQKGVLVIEAAGNGNQNLDHPDYNRPQSGFPPEWRNPFNRTLADCGTIMVGAGAPTYGNHGPDRSRLGFSNYGASPDAQGWGREVVTCGYGDLQRGATRKTYYTRQFSGTSSASPIVVGSVAAVQSKAHHRGLELPPAKWRDLLRKTGSPQQDAPGRPRSERIGNRPNIQELLKTIGLETDEQ